ANDRPRPVEPDPVHGQKQNSLHRLRRTHPGSAPRGHCRLQAVCVVSAGCRETQSGIAMGKPYLREQSFTALKRNEPYPLATWVIAVRCHMATEQTRWELERMCEAGLVKRDPMLSSP